MSTRCNIHFVGWGDVRANVYVHSDGYPDGKHGIPARLERFFADVESQCGGDTRFCDPSYLAAKFIVWQAYENQRYCRERGEEPGRLDFRGVAPCNRDHGDIEYVYVVDCDKHNATGRPTVSWEEV